MQREHSLRGALVSYVYTPIADDGSVTDIITVFDEVHHLSLIHI